MKWHTKLFIHKQWHFNLFNHTYKTSPHSFELCLGFIKIMWYDEKSWYFQYKDDEYLKQISKKWGT